MYPRFIFNRYVLVSKLLSSRLVKGCYSKIFEQFCFIHFVLLYFILFFFVFQGIFNNKVDNICLSNMYVSIREAKAKHPVFLVIYGPVCVCTAGQFQKYCDYNFRTSESE